jgi:hypothetical protein
VYIASSAEKRMFSIEEPISLPESDERDCCFTDEVESHTPEGTPRKT